MVKQTTVYTLNQSTNCTISVILRSVPTNSKIEAISLSVAINRDSSIQPNCSFENIKTVEGAGKKPNTPARKSKQPNSS